MQYTYEYIEIGLYQDLICIAHAQEHKFKASMMLIPMIDSLLKNNNMQSSDLDYIAVNVGPGPYNTLRALIATANAIAFATKIPLVSCNALSLITDFYKQENVQTVALLQAFAGHVYFKHNQMQGYSTIQDLLTHLDSDKRYYFVGNAAIQYKKELQALFSNAICSSDILFPEISLCAKQSLDDFSKQKIQSELHPLYLHQSLH